MCVREGSPSAYSGPSQVVSLLASCVAAPLPRLLPCLLACGTQCELCSHLETVKRQLFTGSRGPRLQRPAGVCCSPRPRVEYGAERHQSGATAPCSLPGATRCEEALFTLGTVNRRLFAESRGTTRSVWQACAALHARALNTAWSADRAARRRRARFPEL